MTATSVVDEIDIAKTYELATGNLVGVERSGRYLVICPSREHSDTHPSCHLTPAREAWICRSCGAKGGKLDLVVAAGHVDDRAGAARWLEGILGRRVEFSRAPRPEVRASDVRAELAHEASALRERQGLGRSERLLTRELNRIRERVARRLRVPLLPLVWVAADFAAAGRERDAAWPAILERAWTIAHVEMSGRPSLVDIDAAARGEHISPVAVWERVEEIAAADLRALITFGKTENAT